MAFISKKYFDGHKMLYPEVKDGFNVIVKFLEELTEVYNDEVMSMARHKPMNGRLIDSASHFRLKRCNEDVEQGAEPEQVIAFAVKKYGTNGRHN